MFLSTASPEEITKYLDSLEGHREAIENEIIDIVYFMPGVDWPSAWGVSPRQREKMIKSIIRNKKAEMGDDTEYM